MIGIFNLQPNFCPKCGENLAEHHQMAREFEDRNSFVCTICEFRYQGASRNEILECADKANGDLSLYTEGMNQDYSK